MKRKILYIIGLLTTVAELTPKQQAVETINKTKRVLLVSSSPDGDAVGSMLALHLVLAKLGKNPQAVISRDLPSFMRFLPQSPSLNQKFSAPRDFVINLSCRDALPDKLVYKKLNGEKLQIIVSPKEGSFKASDVQTEQGRFHFDLIIVLDTASYEHLGDFYVQHRELFSQVPVLNIDHHVSNDLFGQINLVDVAASATAEVLVGLIEALGPNLIDADVATCLLTGILSDTGSFQNANTTPKSLTIAAQMVGFGARHQEVIKNLFKTRSHASLKLWGRILSYLQFETNLKFAWSIASFEDFQACGAEREDSSGIIDQLLVSLPGAEIYLLLSEKKKGKISGSLRTKGEVDASAVAKLFNGGGHTRAAGFELEGSLLEIKNRVVEQIRQWQRERTGQVLSEGGL